MCWQLGMVFSFSKILPPTLHLSPKLFPGPLSRLTWWCVCVSPGDARRWCGVGHRPLSSRYPSARGLTPGDSRLAVATSSPCVRVCVSPNPSLSPLLILAGPFPVVLAAVSNFFLWPARPSTFLSDSHLLAADRFCSGRQRRCSPTPPLFSWRLIAPLSQTAPPLRRHWI